MLPSEPTKLPDIGVVPGDVLAGKYRVERVLGVGGMGAVVLARHLDLDEPVAIKLLLPQYAPEGEPVERFLREARAAKKIRSPHVVQVHDVGRLENGAPFMVMEYLEGSDLAGYVEQHGPLPHTDAVGFVLQACEAIAAAHALGIVHRDLKPANLFLTRMPDGSPCIKVLDFGIAKLADPNPRSGVFQDPLIPVSLAPAAGLTSTATIMGTPCYMSPEQLRSTRDVDGRTDIWSIGAILHALLAGVPPFSGESNIDVSAKIIRDPPCPIRQLRPDVPPQLEHVILTCLQKDVTQRFPDVASLASALASVGSEGAVATANRIARTAAVTGPTLKSAPVPGLAPSSGPPAVSHAGPTRTASAWGESASFRPQHPPKIGRGSTIALALSVIAIVGAAGVWGGARLASRGRALSTSAAVPIVDVSVVASVPEPPTAPATATPPSSEPTADVTPAPPTSTSAVPPAPKTTHVGASAKPPGTTAPRPTATATATKPKNNGGLFDDRE
jgi:eukaryotic-like serine/threonine-protein kinase